MARRYIPDETLFDVRSTYWYPRYISQITAQVNGLADKRAFKTKGGKIKLIGVEGDVVHGAATLAEWTALVEDVDRGYKNGTISLRPQHQRVPLDEVEEALRAKMAIQDT